MNQAKGAQKIVRLMTSSEELFWKLVCGIPFFLSLFNKNLEILSLITTVKNLYEKEEKTHSTYFSP